MRITTTNTKFEDLAIGQEVEIITECVDFTFFNSGQKGIIIKLKDGYLGVIVELNDSVKFNFKPENLKILSTLDIKICKHCKQEIKK